jgi:DNA polymerase-1
MNLCFRCLFSQGKLKSGSQDTGVIYGSTNLLISYVEKFQPEQVYLVGEGKNSRDRRRQLYPEYKANTKNKLPISKESFYSQVDYFKEIAFNLGVKCVSIDSFEADDVIASLCHHYANHKKVIISTDGDLLQLVSENTHVYSPTKEELVTLSNFKEITEVRPEDYVSYKAMVGDSSDNIKGIEGVGPKTALEILNWIDYDFFAEQNEKDIPPKLQKAFTPEAKQQYELAYKLTSLKNVPLTISEIGSSIVHGDFERDEVQDLLQDVSCWSLVERMDEIERIFNGLSRV